MHHFIIKENEFVSYSKTVTEISVRFVALKEMKTKNFRVSKNLSYPISKIRRNPEQHKMNNSED